jgi:hypothetical protein
MIQEDNRSRTLSTCLAEAVMGSQPAASCSEPEVGKDNEVMVIRTNRYKIAGLVLAAFACIGFLTVADEFRHIGELFGVIGILLSGIAFLIAGFFPKLSTVLALQGVAVGIGIGMIGGAASDRMDAGVCVGTVFGLIIGYFMRSRPNNR